jgi:hypothetical protein
VNGVRFAATRHPDVSGGSGGVLVEYDVRGGRRVALRSVGGGGVGELDVLVHVLDGELAAAAIAAGDGDCAV